MKKMQDIFKEWVVVLFVFRHIQELNKKLAVRILVMC